MAAASATVTDVQSLRHSFCSPAIYHSQHATDAAVASATALIVRRAQEGRLEELVRHAASDDSSSLLACACCAGASEAIEALLAAGAQPRGAKEDVLGALLSRAPADAPTAGITQSLIAAGHVTKAHRRWAAHKMVAAGLLRTLQVLSEHGGLGDESDRSALMHTAVENAQVEVYRYLKRVGAQATSLNEFGFTPLGALLHRYCTVQDAEMLSEMLREEVQASTVLHASGVCEGEGVPHTYEQYAMCEYEGSWQGTMGFTRSPITIRVMTFVCAAVAGVPCGPYGTAVAGNMGDQVMDPHDWTPLRTSRMDERVCVAPGDWIHIPSPFHACRDSSAAVRYAVGIDLLLAMRKTTEYPEEADANDHGCIVEEWRERANECITWSVSPTIRVWAWHRRLHALGRRRAGRVGRGAVRVAGGRDSERSYGHGLPS